MFREEGVKRLIIRFFLLGLIILNKKTFVSYTLYSRALKDLPGGGLTNNLRFIFICDAALF